MKGVKNEFLLTASTDRLKKNNITQSLACAKLMWIVLNKLNHKFDKFFFKLYDPFLLNQYAFDYQLQMYIKCIKMFQKVSKTALKRSAFN